MHDCVSIDGHKVIRVKLSAPVVHDLHSCEKIQWKVSKSSVWIEQGLVYPKSTCIIQLYMYTYLWLV